MPRLSCGRTLTFTLGSGSTAQTCTAPSTNASGRGVCTIDNVNQTAGPIPVTDTFASDGYYQSATATGSTVDPCPRGRP